MLRRFFQPLFHNSTKPKSFTLLQFYIKRSLHNKHYVDTYKLMKRLETQGFTRTQAVCVMKLMSSMLNEKVLEIREEILSKSDLEKGNYLFKAALAELKTEVQILRRNDQSTLESDMEVIRKEIDLFKQSLPIEANQLKVELQMDLNSHHQDVSSLNKSIEMSIQDMSNKYSLELSLLKAEIEAMKWEAIRKGILMVFAAASAITFISILFKIKDLYLSPTIQREQDKKELYVSSAFQNDAQAAKEFYPPQTIQKYAQEVKDFGKSSS